MPHNPRRIRGTGSTESALTAERIASAMARGLAIRSQSALDPAHLRCVSLTPEDAVSPEKKRRYELPWNDGQPPTTPQPRPWRLVGWVRQERPFDPAVPRQRDGYDRTWGVWLNIDDDRVWLRPELRR